LQEFAVTAEGLRDNTNLDKTYVVIHTPGKTGAKSCANFSLKTFCNLVK